MERSFSPQHTIQRAITSCGFPPGSRLLLAVSGGIDSTVLLDTVSGLAPQYGWTLRVGHVNHMLRGAESNEDERFVRDLAGAYGLPIDVDRVDVGRIAERARESIEEAAREARYRTLRTWLSDWIGDAILTGHTRDDQAETVLLRLLRGAGLVGLGGMRQSGLIVRPFLTVDRETIEGAANERDLPYRDDSSNLDRRFRRNALRLDVMPAIRHLEVAAPRSIARTACHLQVDADYILVETERALLSLHARSGPQERTVARYAWVALHPALRHYVVRNLLQAVLGDLRGLDTRHIEMIERAVMAGESLTDQLPHGLQVACDGQDFTVAVTKPLPDAVPHPDLLPVPGSLTFGTWIVDVERMERPIHREQLLAVRGKWHALIDEDRVSDGLLVRSRKPGDSIAPPGMTGTRKLQDIMVDSKVPREERQAIPVVVSGDYVLWVPGGPVDRRYVGSAASERLLHLFVKPVPRVP